MACEANDAIRTAVSLTGEEDYLRLYSSSLASIEALHCCLEKSAVLVLSSYRVFRYRPFLLVWLSPCRRSGIQYSAFGAIEAGNAFSFVSSAEGATTDALKPLDSVPEIDTESSEGKILSDRAVRGHVKFENVHFCYPSRPGVRVLRNLTLEVEPGTYVAL